jgi:hypothetical protein
MIDRPRRSMMYRLNTSDGRCQKIPRLVIFSVREANFLQIEDQFGHTALDMFIQILHCSVKKQSGYSQTLLFLRDTCGLDDFVGMAKNK